MDPFGEFLELTGWPRNVEEIGRERLLDLWRFASQPREGFWAAVFGELKNLLGSKRAGEWEEKDWKEVAQALRGVTVEERASLVEVVEARLGSSQPELLERVLTAFEAHCDSRSESQRQCKTSPMTSELNVTVGEEKAIAGPSKKRKSKRNRKLELEADEEAEGPHKALILEDTLDKIISLLDCETKRTARLVCQKWNERTLANFHKDLELILRAPGKHKKSDIKILSSVDERMLSSIKIHSCDKSRFKHVFNYLRSSGKLEGLRVLTITVMDEETLDAFIKVANEGGFRGLETLTFYVQFNSRRKKYKCLNTVAAGALPFLKVLNVHTNVGTEQEARFRAEHLPIALQSFVSGATKLENISSTVYLNLSGREVRTILIGNDSLFRDGEVVQMINSVKDSLVNLNLARCCAELPFLPSLETLAFWDNKNIPLKPIHLNPVPGLKRLELPFNYLPKLLSPVGNLREIQIDWIPAPRTDVLLSLVHPFNLLLNANSDHLVLQFCWVSIPQLLDLLDLVNVEERAAEGRRKSSVVEFQYKPLDDEEDEDEEDENSKYDVEAFSAILEIVGGNWGRVLLKDFRFETKPPKWTETELCLYAGRKKGVARICGEKGRTIYLEIKE